MTNKLIKEPILKIVKKFNKNNNNILTSIEDIVNFEVGTIYQIDEDKIGTIECERLPDTSEGLKFRIVMKKDSRWELLYNNFIETILMYKGSIVNLVNNIVIDKLCSCVVSPFEKHHIYAIKDSIFYIEFKKI